MKKYLSRLATVATISLSAACSNNTFVNNIQAEYVTSSIKDFQKKVIGDILARTLDENEPTMDEELLHNIAINGLQPFFSALKDKDGYLSIVTTYNSSKESEPISHLGTYGVSLQFNSFSNNYQVQEVATGSLAEKAGFQVGDIIRKLNGIDITKLSTKELKETVQHIHEGHPQRIVVDAYRMGTGEIALHLILKSTKTALPVVTPDATGTPDHFSDNVVFRYFPTENVAYMRIFSFSNDNSIGESARAGIRYLLKNNDTKALVIDLRNNGGGYMQEANEVISMFVKNKKTFYIDNRVSPLESKQGFTLPEFYISELEHVPLYILVNRNTASSSEITTICLKELRDDVVIIGEKTYGKGIFQNPLPVNLPVSSKDSYKIEMMISSGEWYSPKGTFVGNPNKPKAEDGIKPDLLFKNEEAMPLAELTKLEDVFLGATMYYIGDQISNAIQIPLYYSNIDFHGSFDNPTVTSSLSPKPSYK